MDKLRVRDFIYLDVDRLRSIVSQAEKGFAETVQLSRDRSAETQAEVEAGLFGFLKARGQQTFAWQTQQTETRSLHDHVFNLLEADLMKGSILTTMPGDFTEANVTDDEMRNQIEATSFLLADGFALINDYSRVVTFLDNAGELTKFLTSLGAQNLPSTLTSQQRKEAKNRLRSELSMDPSLINGIQLIFNLFYKDRIILKLVPFENRIDFRLVGNLEQRFLRDSIDSIIYKYGTNPSQKWRMLAQVADIPAKTPSKIKENFVGADMEVGLQKIFASFRGLEALAQTVAYPEISVTPIAIYRE